MSLRYRVPCRGTVVSRSIIGLMARMPTSSSVGVTGT